MADSVDLDALAVEYSRHAGTCLNEATAAVLEGNLLKATALQSLAETFVALIRALNGDPDDG